MAELTYRDAVAAGIAQEMERDDRVVFLGEDVAAAGGVFKATVGLLDQFGPVRVRDTPISEQAILGALREIAEEHTSLVIAHRLSTIVDADRIIVLDHGKIVEQGTHDALLSQQGPYADLWRAQQKQRQFVPTINTETEHN